MSSTVLISALVLGLASNFHCLGMCGPIAMILPLDRSRLSSMVGGTLLYNAGRIFSYVLLGVLVGFLGLVINIFSFLQWISIAAGIGLIVFAWRYQLIRFFPKFQSRANVMPLYQKGMRWAMQSNSPMKFFVLGNINGLLPCGMVYIALINATVSGSFAGSVTAMIAFGAGTLPVMVAVPLMAQKMNLSKKVFFRRSVPYIITIVGALMLMRGLNLGIPYISPKVKARTEVSVVTEKDEPVKTEIEMECCHKGKSCD